MSTPCFAIVILGLSITSSWGNGHATTYRALMRALTERGHQVVFLERDVPWYASSRDLPQPPYGHTELYTSLDDLRDRFTMAVQQADVVIVGSYVPEGVAVGSWVIETAHGITAFYDIDTPVTLATLRRATCAYLSGDLLPRYALYLSFTGGPILRHLEQTYGARMARPLYCGVDPDLYYPDVGAQQYDLGYLGTYSAGRQAALEELLLKSARHWSPGRFVVAGPQYPATIIWPENVVRLEHLAPSAHRHFYSAQRYTLNLTRADMRQSGYAPSVRLFEAAACGTPIVSDYWPGLETFFSLEYDILVSHSCSDTLRYLCFLPDEIRREVGARARGRVLAEHTAAHRAVALEQYVIEALETSRVST